MDYTKYKGMNYEEMRTTIYRLDKSIEREEGLDERIRLIDEDISLNEYYIEKLKEPVPVMTFLCIVLSIAFGLGLIIFLPQVISRNAKAKIAGERITELKNLRKKTERKIEEGEIKMNEHMETIDERIEDIRKYKSDLEYYYKKRKLFMILGLSFLGGGIGLAILFGLAGLTDSAYYQFPAMLLCAFVVMFILRGALYNDRIRRRKTLIAQLEKEIRESRSDE